MSTLSADSVIEAAVNDGPHPSAMRWWMRGFLLWLAASAAVIVGIYVLVPPIYEAEAVIQLEPPRADPTPGPSISIPISIT